LKATAEVLKHFEQTRHDRPGPFCQGLAQGRLWLDYDTFAPTTLSDIEDYCNTRHLRKHSKLNLKEYPLVFFHLDIAPRNILVLEDGSLCMIDWATAGFYFRLFERCMLELNKRKESDWNDKLLGLLEEIDEDEVLQIRLLQQAYYFSVRYRLYVHSDEQAIVTKMSSNTPGLKQKLPPGMKRKRKPRKHCSEVRSTSSKPGRVLLVLIVLITFVVLVVNLLEPVPPPYLLILKFALKNVIYSLCPSKRIPFQEEIPGWAGLQAIRKGVLHTHAHLRFSKYL
jgi:hypothetical protein